MPPFTGLHSGPHDSAVIRRLRWSLAIKKNRTVGSLTWPREGDSRDQRATIRPWPMPTSDWSPILRNATSGGIRGVKGRGTSSFRGPTSLPAPYKRRSSAPPALRDKRLPGAEGPPEGSQHAGHLALRRVIMTGADSLYPQGQRRYLDNPKKPL